MPLPPPHPFFSRPPPPRSIMYWQPSIARQNYKCMLEEMYLKTKQQTFIPLTMDKMFNTNTSATRKELKCVNLELKMFFHWWTNLGLVFILGAKVFDVQVALWHTGTGMDPHRENPAETENSIPPFALPSPLFSLKPCSGEIWRLLSRNVTQIHLFQE